MDWAIKAAKKKTQVLPGSSRSIIETLNVFNNTISDGQNEINNILNNTCDWLNKEYDLLNNNKPMISSVGVSTSTATTSMVSPEKTIPFDSVDKSSNNINDRDISTTTNTSIYKYDALRTKNITDNINGIEDKSNSTGHTDDKNNSTLTPERRRRGLPSVTPKSLVGGNLTQEFNIQNGTSTNVNSSNDNSKVHKYSAGKSSPWSPYKVEKLLKETAISSSSNVTRLSTTSNSKSVSSIPVDQESNKYNKTATEQTDNLTKGYLTRSDSITLNITEGNTTTTKPKHKIVRDISKRRSNMFVPLPSKDPLIVQPAVSLISNKPLFNTVTRKKSIIEHDKDDTLITSKPSKLFQAKGIPSLFHENTTSTSSRITQSPILMNTIGGTTKIIKSASTTSSINVFDRLSSLPTKSFENKRTWKNMRLSSSSIDVTGSPIRRASPTAKHVDTLDSSMQEALKSIFSTKDLSKNNNSLGNNNSVKNRRSLIPKFNRYDAATGISTSSVKPKLTATNLMNHHHQVSPSSKFSLSRPVNPVNSRPIIESNESNRCTSGVVNKKSTSPQKLRNERNQSSPLRSLAKKPPQASKKENINEKDSGNILEKPSKPLKSQNDRLTRFKLFSSVSTETDTTNLKSRNSTVLQKPSQILPKRKVFKEQRESIRKPIAFTDTSDLSTTNKRLSRTSINIHKTNNKISQKGHINNSVLHDLNTVDHRMKIGESSSLNMPKLVREESAGNQSLPEILSESDDEENLVIASWAKSSTIKEQLMIQQKWDPKQIFGSIPPLHIDEIFQSSRLNKLKSRQSLSKKA